MGMPPVPKPLKMPKPPDLAKAELDALAYADTQRKLKQGRRASFLTTAAPTTTPAAGLPVLPGMRGLR